MIKMKIEGLAALHAQLKQLGPELGAKTLRTAMRKAFKPVQEAAQRKVPKDTHNLEKSIRIGSAMPKAGGTLVAVGLVFANSAGKGRATKEQRESGAAKDPYYWRFVEFGTRFQPARPFLRPAMDPQADRVLDGLKTELAKAIDRAVKRKAKTK